MQDIIFNSGIFVLAILLGIKHSFDADHLVAVSSLLVKSKSISRAVALSLSWSIGHMITASILTIILFTFKDSIFLVIFNNLEILIPVMLLFIGFLTIALEFDIIHFHKHVHGSQDGSITKEHSHLHFHRNKREHGAMMGIGIIHGLASNDELLLLFTLTFAVNSLDQILFGVGVFTFGVIIGMVVYSYSLNWSVNKFKSRNVMRTVNLTIAILSIVYAVWLFSGLEGTNILDLLGINL